MAVGCIEPVPHDLPRDVELWRVDLDLYRRGLDAAVLSTEEQRRAERFHFDDDRRRYLAAHHALRHILGRTLGKEPGALVFAADAHGKPQLQEPRGLEFNLSHSARECLIGVSAHRPIGVDVEVVRPVVDADALARRHFTHGEFEQWVRSPAPDRARAFLQCWTRKEACLKALGTGLAVPPGRIDAGCDNDARRVEAEFGGHRVCINLMSIHLENAAVGAVALADSAT